MSNNINFDYKNLSPFKWFVLENFPFIEADFDSLTEWQLFCKLGKEMNKIIDSQNLVGEQAETLTNAFNNLKNYVDNYFENLDVQDEINNKLNEMAEDGTLTKLIGNYVQPLIDEQNKRINEISNNYTVTNARIDEIVNLPTGSTTGDAQLADIKIGFNGKTYNSPGDAVRGEDSYINNKIKILDMYNNILNIDYEQGGIVPSTGESVTSNYYIRSKNFINTNQNLYCNINNSDYRVIIVWYNNDETIATTTTLSITESKYIPTIYPKCKIIIRKIEDNQPITQNDAYNIIITISRLQTASYNLNNNIIVNFDNTNKIINVKSKLNYIITPSDYDTFNDKNINLNYPTGGATYALCYNNVNGTIETKNIRDFRDGKYVDIMYFTMPSSQTLNEKFIYAFTKNTMVDNIFINSPYKNISILGDSYSTFENWLLPNDRNYYPFDGNDVTNVNQTYWYKLMSSLKASLISNDSFGGSTVAHTIRSGHTYADSFIERMKNSLGINRNGYAKPDLILICGGTNDYWFNVPLGSLKYSNWTDEDLQSFLPAFCYMIDYIKSYNPNARIINITNDLFSDNYKNGISSACSHYNITNVQLADISKQSGHPDITGMQSMFEQILNSLF